MPHDGRPIALTLGDPAGIGVEITLAALTELEPELRHRIVLYGHGASLKAQRAMLLERGVGGLDARPIQVVSRPEEADSEALPLIDVAPGAPGVPWARPNAVGARAQYDALVRAIDDAMSGSVGAIVTAPWTKSILSLAGLPPTGHTEVLTERSGAEQSVMLLAGDALRVALVTAHLPLRAVPDAITGARIERVSEIVERAGRVLYGMDEPRLAVCGLNPHAGEGGVLGEEDAAVIAPAVKRLQQRGLNVTGPHPADTLFGRVVREGTADFVIAMYHDQGLAPLKLWHQGAAANITLGLPFVRTSVDHGTAYDIAGQGVASCASLCYATRLAGRFERALREPPGRR